MSGGRGPGLGVRILLSVMLLELFLLGSGRLIQIGPLTLRMWLFVAALGCALLFTLLRERMDREVLLLLLAFVALTATSALIGLLNHAPLEQVGEDAKPLLFFLSLLFFHLVIREPRQIAHIAGLVRFTSLLLGLGYLSLIALVWAGIIPFGLVYAVASRSGEVFFRGDSAAFYKGFLYLGVGFCFFFAARGVGAKVACVILLAAMVMTLTRGLLLAVSVVLLLGFLIRRQSLVRLQLNIVLLAVAGMMAWAWAVRAFADRAESDAIRLRDVQVIEQSTTWLSLIVGHGLGTNIGSRARIEASYLEILHQQGFLGLLFWGAVAALLTRDFIRAARSGRATEAEPFFLGAIFVFVESATNPFLTNPIGMSLVVVALVVLHRLAGSAPLTISGALDPSRALRRRGRSETESSPARPHPA